MPDEINYQELNGQQLAEALIKTAITVGEFSYNPNISDALRKRKKKELNGIKAELLRRLGA
jgi:hypothetical protein